MSACRACGAPMDWAITEKGRRMPLDPGTVPDGNVRVEIRPEGKVAIVGPPGSGDRVSHFATCPKRGRRRSS